MCHWICHIILRRIHTECSLVYGVEFDVLYTLAKLSTSIIILLLYYILYCRNELRISLCIKVILGHDSATLK